MSLFGILPAAEQRAARMAHNAVPPPTLAVPSDAYRDKILHPPGQEGVPHRQLPHDPARYRKSGLV